MQDAPERVHEDLGGENAGRAGRIVIRRDLDQIEPDNIATFGEAVDEFQDFVIEKAAVARRAGSGRDRRVESIYVACSLAPPAALP